MPERRTVLSAAASSLMLTTVGQSTSAAVAAGPLRGKAALVTGAARGIGRATALELTRKGAAVALLDICDPDAIPALRPYRLASPHDLDETVALVRSEGGNCMPLVADLRSWDATRHATETAIEAYGGLDVLVANAGVNAGDNTTEIGSAAWQALLDVNLTGTLHSVQAALPGLRRRSGGRIIIVTSVQARMGSPWSGGYAATKWGLTGLMKSLAIELGKEGITVNAVAPTAVDTPMLRLSGYVESSDQEQERRMAAENGHTLPVGVLKPEDIAVAISFLAGPAAEHISGITLDINAGRSAHLSA
jgi:NAD(P)-dependent dehydrogenase (short-subunit alcohol dehydrogenase family)